MNRDIMQELEALCSNLRATGEDWERRVKTLSQIPAIVQEAADTGGKAKEDVLRFLREPLTVQLLDRRSAVARQACDVVSAMVALLGVGMDNLAQSLLPTMFKLVVVTVQVISESGHQCILNLLTSCPSSKLLPALGDACKDKHKEVRACCAQYWVKVLDSWPAGPIERNWETVGTSLKTLIEDSDQRTRTAARAAFVALARSLPARAEHFLRGLPAPMAERLQQAAAEGGVQLLPSPQNGADGAPPQGFGRAPSRQAPRRTAADAGTPSASAATSAATMRSQDSGDTASMPPPPARSASQQAVRVPAAGGAAVAAKGQAAARPISRGPGQPSPRDGEGTGPPSARREGSAARGTPSAAASGLGLGRNPSDRAVAAARAASGAGPGGVPSSSTEVVSARRPASVTPGRSRNGVADGAAPNYHAPQYQQAGKPGSAAGRTRSPGPGGAMAPPAAGQQTKPAGFQRSESDQSRASGGAAAGPRTPSAAARGGPPADRTPSGTALRTPQPAGPPPRAATAGPNPFSTPGGFTNSTMMDFSPAVRVPTYAPFLYTPLGPKDLGDLSVARAHLSRTLDCLREAVSDPASHHDTAPLARTLLLTSDLARHGQDGLWTEMAAEALPVLRKALRFPDTSIREYASLVFRDLCVCQPAATWALGEDILAALFSCYADASHEVCALTDESLTSLVDLACEGGDGRAGEAMDRVLNRIERLLAESPGAGAFDTPSANGGGGAGSRPGSTRGSPTGSTASGSAAGGSGGGPHQVVSGALRCLERLVRRASLDVVSPRLQRAVMALSRAMSDSHAEVRKASVLCLATTWRVVGDRFQAYLSTCFNEAQRRLVQIYRQKVL